MTHMKRMSTRRTKVATAQDYGMSFLAHGQDKKKKKTNSAGGKVKKKNATTVVVDGEVEDEMEEKVEEEVADEVEDSNTKDDAISEDVYPTKAAPKAACHCGAINWNQSGMVKLFKKMINTHVLAHPGVSVSKPNAIHKAFLCNYGVCIVYGLTHQQTPHDKEKIDNSSNKWESFKEELNSLFDLSESTKQQKVHDDSVVTVGVSFGMLCTMYNQGLWSANDGETDVKGCLPIYKQFGLELEKMGFVHKG